MFYIPLLASDGYSPLFLSLQMLLIFLLVVKKDEVCSIMIKLSVNLDKDFENILQNENS